MLKDATPIIVANWKMNALLLPSMQFFKALRQHIHDSLIGCEIVICPPHTLLRDMAEKIPNTGVKIGGQDCHYQKCGSYTGDVSAAMLSEMACQFVILGHSERRIAHNEPSELIQKKSSAAHQEKLSTIICVGETVYEREKGLYRDIVRQQLKHSVPISSTDDNTIIAYEPVWAIGTDKTPTVEEIEEMHQFIFDTLMETGQFKNGPRVIYGGSVAPDNAKELLANPYVNGLLVGRSSLDVEAFWQIIEATSGA